MDADHSVPAADGEVATGTASAAGWPRQHVALSPEKYGQARHPLYHPAVSFLRSLRWLSLVEGISTLILFGVAMPLKYFADLPIAVRIAGSIHGFLFVVLGLMLLVAIRKVPLSLRLAALGVIAAVMPGGPFLFDRQLARIERSRGTS